MSQRDDDKDIWWTLLVVFAAGIAVGDVIFRILLDHHFTH